MRNFVWFQTVIFIVFGLINGVINAHQTVFCSRPRKILREKNSGTKYPGTKKQFDRH